MTVTTPRPSPLALPAPAHLVRCPACRQVILHADYPAHWDHAHPPGAALAGIADTWETQAATPDLAAYASLLAAAAWLAVADTLDTCAAQVRATLHPAGEGNTP